MTRAEDSLATATIAMRAAPDAHDTPLLLPTRRLAPPAAPQLVRTTFTTSRTLEYFTEKELSLQIGHARLLWPLALLKELVDNALDACETAGTPPQITIAVEPDALSVTDNGPGLPATTLAAALDYQTRTSDKAFYVSPTRGQLGNALKCVWAAPFVWTGIEGHVQVTAGGTRHAIDVTVDRIAQRPRLTLTPTLAADGNIGTSIRLAWPDVASYLDGGAIPTFYHAPDLPALARGYALFNPHAAFHVTLPGGERVAVNPTSPAWRSWRPGDPTSPHWYGVDHLQALLAAYLSSDRAAARRPVRAFVAEFAGLAGTQKRQAVVAAAGLRGATLGDLVRGDDLDRAAVTRLLAAMQAGARPVPPAALGVLGEAHLRAGLISHHDVAPDSVRYRKIVAEADGLPFALEVAWAVRAADDGGGRAVVVGLNWSPTLRPPLPGLLTLLGEARVDEADPVVVVVHLACPRLVVTDRGKTTLALPAAISAALATAVRAVTKPWTEAKRSADRQQRLSQRALADLRRADRGATPSLKEAAWAVLVACYAAVSDDGRLPANARQIMYAARPLVLALTGGKSWKQAATFTQHLLPDFVSEHPTIAAGWDVVFDARGHLVEPHTGRRTDLGTLEVRHYLAGWRDAAPVASRPVLAMTYPTCGPTNRFRFALFIEKEGFGPLLEAARIAQRFDVAIMSTKGMSVTAARTLVEALAARGVTLLVAHDFDKSGFAILHSLSHDSRRYKFGARPTVVDLGLRLADAQAMSLQSEPVEYDSTVDPRLRLQAHGATAAEQAFLVQRQTRSGWVGERIELNAMRSAQFVGWLEEKLTAAGVRKVVPDAATLAQAYQFAARTAALQDAIDATAQTLAETTIAVPADLAPTVAAALAGTDRAWDEAVAAIARAAPRAPGLTR